MSKNIQSFVLLFGIMALIIAVLCFYFNQKLNTQSEKIVKLEKNISVFISVLNAKMPNIKIQALLEQAEKNNIPSDKLITIIRTLQAKPFQARDYLLKELNLNNEALNSIVKPFDYENGRL